MRAPLEKSGFTLIEVLIALLLLSLLSTGMITVFRTAQRSYEQMVAYRDADSEIVRTERFLRRVLETAYPLSADSAASLLYGLEGSREEIEFSAPAPQSALGSGHYRYRVFLRRNRDRAADLVVRTWLDRGGFGAVRSERDWIDEEVLIGNIASVEWSYVEQADSGSNLSLALWRANWAQRRQLPALIRLDIDFPSGDQRSWPEFVVGPRITNDAQCQFDVVSQDCRENGT